MKVGDRVYFIENNMNVRCVTIKRIRGDLILIKFNNGGGIQVHKSRLFDLETDALRKINKMPEENKLKWHGQML